MASVRRRALGRTRGRMAAGPAADRAVTRNTAGGEAGLGKPVRSVDALRQMRSNGRELSNSPPIVCASKRRPRLLHRILRRRQLLYVNHVFQHWRHFAPIRNPDLHAVLLSFAAPELKMWGGMSGDIRESRVCPIVAPANAVNSALGSALSPRGAAVRRKRAAQADSEVDNSSLMGMMQTACPPRSNAAKPNR